MSEATENFEKLLRELKSKSTNNEEYTEILRELRVAAETKLDNLPCRSGAKRD